MPDLSGNFTIGAVIQGLYTDSGDIAAAMQNLILSENKTFTNGNGNSQMNRLFVDTRTLAAASENLDLAGGLTDRFGNTITLAKLNLLYIKNKSTTSPQILKVGGDANSVPLFGAVADYIVIPPGGVLLWVATVDGIAVTAGTGDILKIENSASFDYDIVIGGSTS